jgi:rhodanese-related sulfurtransferase
MARDHENMSDSFEVTPKQAYELLSAESKAVLIDVREPQEFALSRIDNSFLIPMQTVPAELQKLEALADEKDLLILCHHGVRSLQVTAWLRARGLENCYSIAGGIDRWSREIDSSVPTY